MATHGSIQHGKSWYRILAILLIVLGVIITAMFTITMKNMMSLLDASMEWQSTLLTQTIESTLFDLLAIGNNDAVRQQFSTLSTSLPGIEVSIFDFEGNITFSTNKSTLSKSLTRRLKREGIHDSLKSIIASKSDERHFYHERVATGQSEIMISLIKNEKRCHHCHGESHDVLGGIYIRNSLHQWLNIIESSKLRIITVGIIGFFIIFLVTAYYFHRLVNLFRTTISRIQQSSEAVVGSADVLINTSEQLSQKIQTLADGSLNSLDATENSATNLSNIATTGREVSSQINEIARTSKAMTERIEKIRIASNENTKLMMEIVEATLEIKDSLIDNNELINKINIFLGSLLDDTQKGAEKSELARANSDEVQNTIQSLLEAAKDIDDILLLIEEINSQSNVLALNAEIEAARAGVAGRGFMVVASEMRQLSRQTAKATEDVSKRIVVLQEKVVETNSKNNVNADLINQMNELMQSFSQLAVRRQKSILDLMNYMKEVTSNIDTVSQQLLHVSERTSDSLDEIYNFATYEKHLKTSIDEVAQSTGIIAQDVVTAAHEVATINEELSKFDSILEIVTAEILKTDEQGKKLFELSQSLQNFIDDINV